MKYKTQNGSWCCEATEEMGHSLVTFQFVSPYLTGGFGFSAVAQILKGPDNNICCCWGNQCRSLLGC